MNPKPQNNSKDTYEKKHESKHTTSIQISCISTINKTWSFHHCNLKNPSLLHSSLPPLNPNMGWLPPNLCAILFLVFNSFFFFFFFFFINCLAIDEQGQALLSWKLTLSSSTDVLSSWNSSDPNPCKWFGVACNSRLEVISLKIELVDLKGPLPSNLQSLKSLKMIILSEANFTGHIPAEFGEYRELTFLDLSKNQIAGEIPAEICKLTKLQTLALHSNFLQGAIPADIGNLPSLTHLTLYDNYISGEVPASVGKLERLEVFRAGGNQNLRGSLPAEIGNCRSLVMLGLAETGLSGRLPSTIGLLKRIQTIAIYTSQLSGPIPGEIGNCTELTKLYLYQNSLSGPIPPEIGRLRNLQTLLLWQNNLVGAIPPELGQCEQLVLDLSLNSLTGSIPRSVGKLRSLQQLQLSTNQLAGAIPSEMSNCTALTDIEVDNNDLSGEIGIDFTRLVNLTLFYAWQNRLTGSIPASLAQCRNLQSMDLSYNNLTGSIPKELYGLQNLTKLLLLSNELTGFVQPEIGNCTNLFRLRLNDNLLGGAIPAEISKLENLNFLDMSRNRLVGPIPAAISGCHNLEFLDLRSNALSGALPESLPRSLQFVDFSDNKLTGVISPGIGSLPKLTKLMLGRNQLSGAIPGQLGSCSKLQLLDLGDNFLSGEMPGELGQLPALEISLNLSCNRLSGEIPQQFSSLRKLGCLDISHNELHGDLGVLAGLQNLISLNVSFNAFSGKLPDTPFFRNLPLADLEGNHGLLIADGRLSAQETSNRAPVSTLKLAMTFLIVVSAALLLTAAYVLARARAAPRGDADDAWEITLYQKLDLSADDLLRGLTSANVVGTGSSGVVYKVCIPSGETLAVKKMWSPADDDSGAFRSEIAALSTIRHRNIVRLLGWGLNRSAKLMFYNYLPNGSLSSFLHRGRKEAAAWETRYEIAAGLAHAVAYLHHDCLPAILHGDIKAMNVLLGPNFEPYLADFGLARVLADGEPAHNSDTASCPRIAGSYGYMAPEHASMQRITEKSDVYSYGVVLLEVLTGRHPLDPSLPGGLDLVQWVRVHLQRKLDPVQLLDGRLLGRPEHQVQEMLQALSISVLCVSNRPDERPAMKDVVSLLEEVRRPANDEKKKEPVVACAAGDVELPGSSNCSSVMSDYSS
ncbi:LRR receptor-like serine/threonine-protein kinase RGI3 [Zingiber officinale]|uniref:LRR receptor-like serine/threonine-protein kinase RGI3 n=1 Tax=Zingiber officinale TaxID=94328 RepID=UPI001C4D4C87|nr:LRR receptor-like serine/threonine-protein kinase RGI3 [Zingiber officinale]